MGYFGPKIYKMFRSGNGRNRTYFGDRIEYKYPGRGGFESQKNNRNGEKWRKSGQEGNYQFN